MSEKINKNIIDVKIHGKQYSLKGQEDVGYLQQIATFVDTKMNEITKLCPGLSTSSVAVLTCINISDLYLKEKNKLLNQEKQEKIEFTQAIERLKRQNEALLSENQKLVEENNNQKQLIEEANKQREIIEEESLEQIQEIEKANTKKIEKLKNDNLQIIKNLENEKLRNNTFNLQKMTDLENKKELLEKSNIEKTNEIEKLKKEYLDLKKEFNDFVTEFDEKK